MRENRLLPEVVGSSVRRTMNRGGDVVGVSEMNTVQQVARARAHVHFEEEEEQLPLKAELRKSARLVTSSVITNDLLRTESPPPQTPRKHWTCEDAGDDEDEEAALRRDTEASEDVRKLRIAEVAMAATENPEYGGSSSRARHWGRGGECSRGMLASSGAVGYNMDLVKTPEPNYSAPRKHTKSLYTSDNTSDESGTTDDILNGSRPKRKLSSMTEPCVTRRVAEKRHSVTRIFGLGGLGGPHGPAGAGEGALAEKLVHVDGTGLREPPNIKVQHREAKQAQRRQVTKTSCVRSLFGSGSSARGVTPTLEEMKAFARRAGVVTSKM